MIRFNRQQISKTSQPIIVATVAALLLATSVFAHDSNTQPTSLEGEPTLKVVTPSENQTIYGDRIPILISTDNFQLMNFETNPFLKSGQGHIHLWMDDPSPTAESAKKLIDDHFTYTDVAYGQHTLKAELVNNNHTPLNPPVVATVTFKNAPVSSPTPAASTGFDKNTALVILIVVALVIVAAWWYTNEEEEAIPPAKTKSRVKTRTRSRKK